MFNSFKQKLSFLFPIKKTLVFVMRYKRVLKPIDNKKILAFCINKYYKTFRK